NLAEEEGAVKVRREKHVVEHQQRKRQHGHRAENVPQIRQRCETPLRDVELEKPVNHPGVYEVSGQNDHEPMIALLEAHILETNIKCSHDRRRSGGEIVDDDQKATRVAEKSPHAATIDRVGR